MMFDFGPAWQAIRVTADYSNAMLVAVLPCFSDYAHKLQLPPPHPIAIADVARFAIVPFLDNERQPMGTSVQLKNGWSLSMHGGYFAAFAGPKCYEVLQDPDQSAKFFGPIRMSKADAVGMARKTILNLGVPLDAVFAEQEPHVTGPPIAFDTNKIPRYYVEWYDPRNTVDTSGPQAGQMYSPSVDMEINADAKRVEMLHFSPYVCQQVLRRHLIKVGIDPPVSPNNVEWPAVNLEYARMLVPIVLRAIDSYGQVLKLPIPRPLTTNDVARFFLADNGGWPHSEVELTNGWRFVYRNSMVNGFYAPDNLFNSDKRAIRVADFLGKSRMTEAEAIQLVRATIKKFNYSTNLVHLDFKPSVRVSRVPGISRLWISWAYVSNNDLQSKIEAEVDTGKRELKSLYYDDQAYWNHPPEIDVPISLPGKAKAGQP
jgi:nitrogen fixation protein